MVFPDTSRILMMLRHNGEIHQVMICEILHIMSMVHRAVMHLSLTITGSQVFGLRMKPMWLPFRLKVR